MSFNQIDRIQSERAQWARYNFPHADAKEHALGICEEAGELAHAILKMNPGTVDDTPIRGTEAKLVEEAADALGDLLVYACGVATDLGLVLSECFQAAWDEVKDRDWVKYPERGKPPSMKKDLRLRPSPEEGSTNYE